MKAPPVKQIRATHPASRNTQSGRTGAGCGLVLLAALSHGRTLLSEAPRTAGSHTSQHGTPHSGAPQPYLGIDFRDVGDDQVVPLKLKDTKGAEIIRVDHDAPAGKMGLREHDVVLQMNGVAIDGQEQLRRMLRDCPPGKTVVMTIARDGQTIVVSAPMADRAELERQAWEQHLAGPQAPAFAVPTGDVAPPALAPASTAPTTFTSRYGKGFLGSLLTSPTYTGLLLEPVGPQLGSYFGVNGSGLLIRSVADNSPAALAGIRAGDVVVKANATPVGNLNRWTKTVREAKGRPISIVIVRDRQEKVLVLTPDVKRKSSLEQHMLPDVSTTSGPLPS